MSPTTSSDLSTSFQRGILGIHAGEERCLSLDGVARLHYMKLMKLVTAIKLKPSKEQAQALKQTLERCNEACSWIAARGFEAKAYRQFDLQKLLYRDVRGTFGLTAQAAIQSIKKVADAYKINRDAAPIFRRLAAQPYDDRIFRFSGETVSIWTLGGRIKLPFVCGELQRAALAFRKGEADLAFIRGKWFLICACDVPETEGFDPEDWIGVDLGIANIANTSDGDRFCGKATLKTRDRYAALRAHHQRRAATAAKRSVRRNQRRKLQTMSGQEARFRKHENHVISKVLVATAKRTARGLALEDLTHIRSRAKARGKKQRGRLHGWSFRQLRTFVAYKAALSGVPVRLVHPAYTSQGCSSCGYIDRKNRPNQPTFSCLACGHAENADLNAAKTIRSLARRPILTPSENSRAA
jgi:putative transposase